MKNKKAEKGHNDSHGGHGHETDVQHEPVEAGLTGSQEAVQAERVEKAEEGKLKMIEQELDDQKDKYVRLYAEFDNYRKRMIKERDDISRRCNEELVTALLPTLDNLETAFKHAQDASEALLQGVEMTMREFRRTLEKFGLKPIDALGQPFNPEFHHAIAQEDRDDVPDKTVVEELRSGYLFNDRVIRASMVVVSKGQSIPKEDL